MRSDRAQPFHTAFRRHGEDSGAVVWTVPEAMVYRSVANPWATPEEFASYADVVRRRAGDPVMTAAVADVGHFEFLAPRSTAWPQVIRAVQWALSDR